MYVEWTQTTKTSTNRTIAVMSVFMQGVAGWAPTSIGTIIVPTEIFKLARVAPIQTLVYVYEVIFDT